MGLIPTAAACSMPAATFMALRRQAALRATARSSSYRHGKEAAGLSTYCIALAPTSPMVFPLTEAWWSMPTAIFTAPLSRGQLGAGDGVRAVARQRRILDRERVV